MKYMKIITKTGDEIIVDKCNYSFLMRFTWWVQKPSNHVVSQIRLPNSDKRVYLSMARLIMGVPSSDAVVDHINGNPLDNSLANLRICTSAENMRNKRPRKTRLSKIKYKGVYKSAIYKGHQTYVAQITHNGERIISRRFKTELEAAKAYDALAQQYHGEFACTNKMLKLY